MDAKSLKIAAAREALSHVEDGMKLGIGTGSTAEEFVRLLAERVAEGLESRRSDVRADRRSLPANLGVKLSTLEELPELDLTIDGADEFDRLAQPDQGRRRCACCGKRSWLPRPSG